jgi:hypothetical protein
MKTYIAPAALDFGVVNLGRSGGRGKNPSVEVTCAASATGHGVSLSKFSDKVGGFGRIPGAQPCGLWAFTWLNRVPYARQNLLLNKPSGKRTLTLVNLEPGKIRVKKHQFRIFRP